MGPGLQQERRSLRLHRQQLSQRLHGHPQSLFRVGPRLDGIGNAEIEDHKKAHAHRRRPPEGRLGGYTSACGHTVYTARAFPPEYWDKVSFGCEPTEHLIHVDLVDPSGSGYVSHDGYNLLASDDSYVSPIQSVVGPDGSLYFIDWYTYVVQHNPTPPGFHGPGGAYVTPLATKITAASTGSSTTAQAATRRSTSPGHTRRRWSRRRRAITSSALQAQRLLVERQSRDVAPPGLDSLPPTRRSMPPETIPRSFTPSGLCTAWG